MTDSQLAGLQGGQRADDDRALALQYAPLLRMDAHEPFLPLAFGYTIFREDHESPSFPRRVQLPFGCSFAIEYAIWWDWDIEHLYELEHIWVYVGLDDRVIAADASWHGEWRSMRSQDGSLPLLDGRVSPCSEPGKHAFAPDPAILLKQKSKTGLACGPRAGTSGVHLTPLFAGRITERNVINNQLVWTWLQRKRFEPAWNFS